MRPRRTRAWLAVILVAGCDPEPLELQNLLVSFGDHDAGSGRAGDFVFLETGDPIFLEFGAVVEGPDGPKQLPTFEYRVDPDADVLAPASGRVVRRVHQPETDDYELTIGAGSVQVNVDHVRDLQVDEGDDVVAGDVLGRPGPWSDTLGRTELMVVEDEVAHCPLTWVAPELEDALAAQVSALMADWEAFRGDDTIYDEAAMPRPGCNRLTWTDEG